MARFKEEEPPSIALMRSRARVAAILPGTRYADPSKNIGAIGTTSSLTPAGLWSDIFTNKQTGMSTASPRTQAAALTQRLNANDPNAMRGLSPDAIASILPGSSTSGTQTAAAPITGFWNQLATGSASLSPAAQSAPAGFSFGAGAQGFTPSISSMASGGENHAQTWDRVASTPPPPRMMSGVNAQGVPVNTLFASPYRTPGASAPVATSGASPRGHYIGDETGNRTGQFSQSVITSTGYAPRPVASYIGDETGDRTAQFTQRRKSDLLAGTPWRR